MTRPGGPGPPTGTPVMTGRPVPKVTLSPYVQELADLRKELQAGYFSAAMTGLFDCIAMKDGRHVMRLVRRWENEFENLNNIEKIYQFGKPFHTALNDLTTSIQTLPTDVIKEAAKVLQHTMFTRRQTLTKDINSVIDYIDTMYNEEDGTALLKAVENIQKYPNNSLTAEKVLRDFSQAVLFPTFRYHNKRQEKVLFDSLNQLLMNHQEGLPLAPPARRNIKKHKLNEEQEKILEFKQKYMRGNSNTSGFGLTTKMKQTKHKLTQKTTNTIVKKPVRQQRFQVKGDFKQRSDNKTTAKEVTIKTTTAKATNVSSDKNKHKIHPHKKISIAKLLRLKIEHPKLYKKYFKRKKKSHHKKKHKRSKHKLTKKDKLLLKYKVMEFEYQKLLKKLKAKHHDKSNNEKTKTNTNYLDIKKLMEEFINEKLKVNTNLRKHDEISIKPSVKQVQKWQPIKTDSNHFVSFSLNPITGKPDVLAEKFKKFNKDKKTKRKNKYFKLLPSSYSDDEDVIRVNIDDALKHNNKVEARRHNTEEIIYKTNKLNRYSSYSSDETLLKSKIYKALVFNDFSESNSEELDENNKKKLKNTVRKLLTRRSYIKPVNIASSYSDDEEIIRKKLNI